MLLYLHCFICFFLLLIYSKTCIKAWQECRGCNTVFLRFGFTGNYIRDLRLWPCTRPVAEFTGRAELHTDILLWPGWQQNYTATLYRNFLVVYSNHISDIILHRFIFQSKGFYQMVLCFPLTTRWTVAWGSRFVRCDIRHSWHSCWIMEVYAPLKTRQDRWIRVECFNIEQYASPQ